jgi:hypothetical protein
MINQEICWNYLKVQFFLEKSLGIKMDNLKTAVFWLGGVLCMHLLLLNEGTVLKLL